MKTIDVLGKPCPIPVIETKRALSDPAQVAVLIKVDNIIAVQNLEKMAKGYGHNFSYTEIAVNSYEVVIGKEAHVPTAPKDEINTPQIARAGAPPKGLAVVISRNTMGEGAEDLGKILMKGFIYSLTELPTPPGFVVFLNSGAFLTSDGSTTVDDLKSLAEKGAQILTCGACIDHYKISDKLAVGEVTNMYHIAEIMASAGNVVNI